MGRKHFTLLPPVEAPCVNERSVLAGTYMEDMKVEIDKPVQYVPFATWDPDEPEINATAYSKYSRPMRVTLEEGDMLYLPALWYHKVGQSCNAEGVCVAVNYWYDLDFAGGFWSMAGFVRSVGLLSMEDGGKGSAVRKDEKEGDAGVEDGKE
jgi:jumonji domain-containing protein 7